MPVIATRLAGACEDVNVMTNRARCRADCRLVALHAGDTLRVPSAAQWLVLVLDGALVASSLRGDPAAHDLAAHDTAAQDPAANELLAGDALRGEGAGPQLLARTHGTALVVAFTPLAEAS